MIIIEDFTKGFTYERGNYKLFTEKYFPVDGWTKHNLGTTDWLEDGLDTNVYGFSYGDLENKPVIFLEGALHGSEWQPAHQLVEFMRILNNPTNNPNAQLINEIRTKFSFFVIPIANPYGYDKDSRFNINNVDLNRNWDYYWQEWDGDNYGGTKGDYPFSEKETQIIRDKVFELRPVAYFAYHTHGPNRINTKVHTPDNPDTIGYKVLLQDMMDSLKFLGGRAPFIEENYTQNRPTSIAWVSNFMSEQGIRPICGMPEVGIGERDYGFNEANKVQMQMGVNLAFLVCIYSLFHLEKGYLQINNADIY